MDFVDRKRYYNRCLPDEPLAPDDDRNVDFDLLGERSGLPVRGVNWTEKIVEEISLSEKPVRKLFTGLAGSGKTTELKRLAVRLADREGANLEPVFIDASEVLDLSEPVGTVDLILSIVHGIDSAVSAKALKSGGEAEESFLKKLWERMRASDAEWSEPEFSVSDPDNLIFEMKIRPALRRKVRKTLVDNFLRFESDYRTSLGRLVETTVENFNRAGVIVILDSLEKLRGVTANRDVVLDCAEKVFAYEISSYLPPVHTILTVPPALTTRLEDFDFLPMIKVRDRAGAPYEPGIYAARELILKRTPEEALEEIFGININTRMDRISQYSGGCPRDMVSMLRMCLAQKRQPLADSRFESILNQTSNYYRGLVPPDDASWLAKVASRRHLALKDEKNRKKIEHALSNNIVLRYLNDALWYDLHPAVLENPAVQKILKTFEEK